MSLLITVKLIILSCMILSDGFDYYINKILQKENINGLTIYSNKLTINSFGKLIPEFPLF